MLIHANILKPKRVIADDVGQRADKL